MLDGEVLPFNRGCWSRLRVRTSGATYKQQQQAGREFFETGCPRTLPHLVWLSAAGGSRIVVVELLRTVDSCCAPALPSSVSEWRRPKSLEFLPISHFECRKCAGNERPSVRMTGAISKTSQDAPRHSEIRRDE
jgi:hypothetical protein